MTIGQLIQQKRQEREMSLEDVGQAVGVNKTTISRWEKDSINIDRKHISKLCKTLDIDPMIFCYPNEVIFPEERELIQAWRVADLLDKELVRRTLGLNPKKDMSQSAL